MGCEGPTVRTQTYRPRAMARATWRANGARGQRMRRSAEPTDRAAPMKLMDMATGHWKSAVVREFAAMEVPAALRDGPLPDEEIARRCGMHVGAGKRFLRAAEGLGLLVKDGGTLRLSEMGAWLDKERPDSFAYTVLLESSIPHVLAWTGTQEFLRTGEKSVSSTLKVDNYWELFHSESAFPDHLELFSKGMTSGSTVEVASILQSEINFKAHQTFADVGGSEGMLLIGLLETCPGSTGVVVDLPEVVKRVQVPATLEGRIETSAGSFLDRDAIPKGMDAYLLKHIIHDWDDEPSVQILSNIAQAMNDRSVVYVFEMIVSEEGGPDLSKMFDLHMGIILSGKERTVAEFETLFHAAGLKLSEVHRTESHLSILKAIKS